MSVMRWERALEVALSGDGAEGLAFSSSGGMNGTQREAGLESSVFCTSPGLPLSFWACVTGAGWLAGCGHAFGAGHPWEVLPG
eukprot:scaffold50545_cov24-Prasinocladus_malaysianus.AAC.1